MKTIIAPTDFSAISLNAVEYAADLARVIGADLALIHVCAVPLSFSEVPVPVNTMVELVSEAEEKLKKTKEKIMLRTEGKIRIYTVVKQGDVISELDDLCATTNPYAVIMGAESARAFERFLIGGKTVSAVKQLPWPLIIVPSGVKFSSIRKIGLTCDFRKVIDTIPVKEIEDMVREFHAELHVLHVSTESGESYSDDLIEESEWLRDILGDLNPKYHFINDKDIEKGVAEFAEKNNLDLLIIIPKRHNLVSNIFRKSHSKRLVLHAHVPVMAIHE